MALDIRRRKTEHAGAKRGFGAFYGRKAMAKNASGKERRRTERETVGAALREAEVGRDTAVIAEPAHVSTDGRRATSGMK
jgi:hypothetical protein